MQKQTEKRLVTVLLSENWDDNDSGLTSDRVEEAVSAIVATAQSAITALLEEENNRTYNGICLARTISVSSDLEVCFRLEMDLED